MLQKLTIGILIVLSFLTVDSFGQVEKRLIEIDSLYAQFNNGANLEVLPELEECLEEKGLPEILMASIAVTLHNYYALSNNVKFDIDVVNKWVNKYIETDQIFKHEELFKLDNGIISIAEDLNSAVYNFDLQIKYLIISEKGYRTLARDTISEDYFNLLYNLVEACYFEVQPKIGIKYGEIALRILHSDWQISDQDIQYLHFLISYLYLLENNNVLAANHYSYCPNIANEILRKDTTNYIDYLELVSIGYETLTDFEKAIKVQEQLVKYKMESFGVKHPSYLKSLNNLAYKYSNLGNFSHALEINLKVNELYKEIFGEHHADYLTSLNNLASTYLDLGNYSQALEINLKVVELRKEVLGNKHPDYFSSLNNLGITYSHLGDYSKALEINLKVVELREEVLGTRHPSYLRSLNNLASLYSYLGEYDKALELGLKVRELYEEVLGNRHPEYLASLNNLASKYSDLGNYEEALEVYIEVSELNKEVLGDNHPNYLTSLNNLAYTYSDLGNYSHALELYLKVCGLRKEILGDHHPDYLTSLNNLASAYSYLGDYEKALEINLMVCNLRKEVLGDHHPDYLRSLNNLAFRYSDLGNYSQALEINLKVSELYKEVLGDRHPDYLRSLNNLASTYSDLGDYSQAMEINLIVVEFRKEVLGDKHPDYLRSLSNLASTYSDIGKFNKALEINLEVVELRKEVLGNKHPNYLISLNNLASTYSEIGNYSQALEINLKISDLYREIMGDRHPDYLRSLNNLASTYSDLGNYSQALEINLKVSELYKEVLGNKHPNYLLSLNNLASTYSNLGDHVKALDLSLKVSELYKEILGDRHPDYLTSLNNLAIRYSDLGNYSQALEINLKVSGLYKEVLGDRHPDYLRSLINLAPKYSYVGEYAKALRINLEAGELVREVLGDSHTLYFTCQNNLAQAYFDINNYGKALEINQQVAELRKKFLGENHPDYIQSLNNLAQVYAKLGKYREAMEINLKVIKLDKKILGNYHPDYLISLSNLAFNEIFIGLNDSSIVHYIEVYNKTKSRMVDNIAVMTENQRRQLWFKYSIIFDLVPFFLEANPKKNPTEFGSVYDAILFRKGLLLNTTRDFEQLIQEKGTPEAIAKFEELKLLKLQIQKLSEQPIDQRYLDVDSLQDLAQTKETELLKLSKEYGDYTRNLKITWKDVQTKLKEGEVAIEFVEYPTLSDTVKYAALVLRKDWEYPKMIYLFQKDELNNLINQSVDRIYTNGYVGQQIKKLIWDPLEDFVSKGYKIYFSPSGLLHQIAIENLPANDSMTLEEYYPMYRLSSTKELVINKPKGDNKSSALYGGLFYDIADSIMVAQSRMYDQITTSAYAMRGYNQDSTLRQGWNYLGGTLTEVDQIGDMMTSGDYQVVKYTGIEGNEESFKALSGRNTGIIHIATHGFFLPIEDTRRNEFMQARLGDQPSGSILSDPMQRSGLMLAGGNRAWQGEEIPTEIEDGVLTAKEISHLDLRGTDLVVLSACETGLGEVSSEGVFGLQRSFKQAGAQSLIMTLWEVNDKATDYFMTEFYRSYLAGKEKQESFLEAKKSCREKFNEPRYWAGFVLLD